MKTGEDRHFGDFVHVIASDFVIVYPVTQYHYLPMIGVVVILDPVGLLDDGSVSFEVSFNDLVKHPLPIDVRQPKDFILDEQG
jgi:hypothetical protein